MSFAAHVRGARIVIVGRTNLPENSRVLVGAWRAFRQVHGDVRDSGIGKGTPPDPITAIVSHRRFGASIPIQEDTMTVGVDPAHDPEGAFAEVDPDATTCARFMTGRDVVEHGPWEQPDPRVRAAVGNWGNHLRGSPHVHTFGSLTKVPSKYIEVARRVPVPAAGVLSKIAALQTTAPQVRPLAGFCAF